MRHLTIVLACALLIGCTREPTPIALTGDQLMVHSVVRAGSDTVHVYLSRSLSDPIRDPNVPGGFVFSRPISGAEVRLTRGQSSIILREAPAGFTGCSAVSATPDEPAPHPEPGCYAARLPSAVQSGEQYDLEVNLGAAGSAEGRASIPELPEFREVSGRTRYAVAFGPGFWGGPLSTIPVRYRVPSQVTGIRVGVQVEEVFRGGSIDPDARCSPLGGDHFVRRSAPTDSTRAELWGVYCQRAAGAGRWEEFSPDSVYGRILLTGFDSTYVRFAEAAQQRSAEASRLRAGVTGALGVFAGAATAAHPIVLVPQAQEPR